MRLFGLTSAKQDAPDRAARAENSKAVCLQGFAEAREARASCEGRPANPAAKLQEKSHLAAGTMYPTISVSAADAVRGALDALERHAGALDEEGLWRESGSAVRVLALTNTLATIKTGSAVQIKRLLADGEDSHAVVGAVKGVLRRHQPLLTYTRCSAFVQASLSKPTDGSDEAVFRKKVVRALVDELPPINRQLLGRLSAHLKKVVKRSSSNRMSWSALAISLAPTLLRQTEAKDEAVTREQIEQIQVKARCAKNRRRSRQTEAQS
ncbi:RhoGAP domain-containing protein [Pelagophyceae sp. CCMP2097]|nr:RhoGAP domain-containing protein [Pelagophyceae sp. CCMP2097]